MEYQHPSSATAFSKKLANGGSFSGNHVYDGVFDGTTKFGTRMEDYGEIFGGSGNSSIPILDFPELKDSKASVEARNSRPDYSKIFGAFGDADFAVPYEELFSQPKKVKKNSSKQARAAAEEKVSFVRPKHSSFLEEKQSPSPEVCFQSFDGVKQQLNLSYDKSKPGSENGTNGMTRVAQLNAVSSYACLNDESNPVRMAEGDKRSHPALNVAHVNCNVRDGKIQVKTLRKVVSGPQPRGASIDTSRIRADIPKKSSRNKSFSNDITFDASETGLGTQPSPLPPLCLLHNSGNHRDGSTLGYSCSVDEMKTLQTTAGDKPLNAALNDTHMNNISEGVMQRKTLRKVVSGPQPRVAATDMSRSHADFQKKSSRNKSFSNDISFDAFGIGLGTQPSSMSPLISQTNYGNKGDGFTWSMNSQFGACRGDASEVADGSYSPPFLDEEIDANSAAATSAAAVRKAIEEAKAKLKLAKELMERKKEGIPNRVKRSVSKSSRREVETAEKANGSSEKLPERHQKVDFTSLTKPDAMKPAQVTLEFRNEKQSSPLRSVIEDKHIREFSWTKVDRRLVSEGQEAVKGFPVPDGTGEDRDMELKVKQVDNVLKAKPSDSEIKCEEKITEKEKTRKPIECARKEAVEEAHQQNKIEREQKSVEALFGWNVYRNIIKSAEELSYEKEIKEKIRDAFKNEEVDQTCKAPNEQKEPDSMLKALHESEESARCESQELEEIVDMEEPKEARDSTEIENKERAGLNQDDPSIEVPVGEENESRLAESQRHGGDGMVQEEDLERLECEKKQRKHWDQEAITKKQNDVFKLVNVENLGQVHNQEATEVRFNDCQDQEESEKGLGNDCRTKYKMGLDEAGQNEMVNKVFKINEIEKENTCEWVESERIHSEFHLEAGNENEMEATQLAIGYQEANNNVNKLEGEVNTGNADEAHGDDEKFGDVEVGGEVFVEEVSGIVAEVTEDFFTEETEKGSSVEEENDLEEENFEIGVPEEGINGLDAIKKQKADSCSGETDLNFDHRKSEYQETENCEHEKYIEERTARLDGNYEYVGEFVISSDDEENESVSSHEMLSGNEIDSETPCGLEKDVKETACSLEENNNDVEESEIAINLEGCETDFGSSDEKWVNNGNQVQASPVAHICDREGKSAEISRDETTRQIADEKEEIHWETVTVEKREAEDISQKEVELDKKQQRRKDEAKLKEMEKEKERIAVERAIREARERAFAEARERAERAAAERATAEAHQRALADARERLEKACAEANGKSAAEKASMEAKIKAERAAVERATAEARVRALEKAMSDKAKNQAEKFSGASRDAGIKSSDQQYKGPAPSSNSRYSSSSNPDERFNGANGESTERCKATLARNQRTAERAAKALAEKNMRDLLAQKEQAERNRLAETLDADVKRWSSGKERNLRALLSTLQYVLGLDSGWQAIPLTELITTAAVKKAYRKATLFVHPDKLQQRGASIQQKYTCEKVFDLLKDAWNKFSADER